MLSVRAGSGLGDSLYLQAIARHLMLKGESVEVCSDWPDVFLPLVFGPRIKAGIDPSIEVSPFRRDRIDRVAHYTTRKTIPDTDQFQDCCIRAGITEPVELRLDWAVTDAGTAAFFEMCPGQARASGEALWPVIVVALPRAPMGRSDGFGAELLPDCRVIQRVIDRLRGRAFLVQVGTGEPLFRFSGLDLDLAGKTTVRELIDVASLADGFLGYPSFLVPLGESFARPGLFVWSRRGLNPGSGPGAGAGPRPDFIRSITPRKVLHRLSSRAIVDDAGDEDIDAAADALLAAAAEM